MRKTLLFLVFVFMAYFVKSQSFYAGFDYKTTSYMRFSKNPGYSLAFSYNPWERSKISIEFSQHFNNKYYTDTFFADYDGRTYFRRVTPQNMMLSVALGFDYDLIKNEKWGLWIGMRAGLGYFKTNEVFIENEVGHTETDTIHYDFWEKKNRFFTGVSLTLERQLTKRISVFVSTESSIIFYTRTMLCGSPYPPFIGSMNYKAGLVYSFIKP